MEKHGVVGVGGHYGMGFTDSGGYTEDGRPKAVKSVDYPGWQKPRTREEAIRVFVMGGGGGPCIPDSGLKLVFGLAKDWNINGALSHGIGAVRVGAGAGWKSIMPFAT
jgi:hypothetical protein